MKPNLKENGNYKELIIPCKACGKDFKFYLSMNIYEEDVINRVKDMLLVGGLLTLKVPQ